MSLLHLSIRVFVKEQIAKVGCSRDNKIHGWAVGAASAALTELLATFLKLFAARRARFTANQANTVCQPSLWAPVPGLRSCHCPRTHLLN